MQQRYAPGMRVEIRDAEWRIMRVDDPDHRFKPDSQLADIVSIYRFDSELRQLVRYSPRADGLPRRLAVSLESP